MSIEPSHNDSLRSRGTLRSVVPFALALIGALFYLPPSGIGQQAGVNQGGPDYLHAPAGLNPMPQQNPSEGAAKLDQMREAARRERVASDTARLLVLSNELKAEVDQSPKDQLSLNIIRKAAEIEKLAHDVKERMKY